MQNVPMSKVIRRKKTEEVVIPKFEESREDLIAKIQARRNFKSMAEKVAGDSLYHRNYYYPGAREFFTQDQQSLLTVDKYFPYAEGGALYIDEPQLPMDEKDCQVKMQAMKKMNLRYLVIKRGMTELDCMEAIA